jgi:DHA3 family macrolide efflux protein-like MFS transporter
MSIAFLVGAAYVVVAISAQTQLQEDLPEDVRGRVFGVLGMLVSIASLAPIIIVAPLADLVGREPVILAAGIIVFAWGVASTLSRLSSPLSDDARAPSTPSGAPVDPITAATTPSDLGVGGASSPGAAKRSRLRRRARGHAVEDGEAT